MDLKEKTDLEIMTLYAEMMAAKEQLLNNLAAVQNEWMRRVHEEKEKSKHMVAKGVLKENKSDMQKADQIFDKYNQ